MVTLVWRGYPAFCLLYDRIAHAFTGLGSITTNLLKRKTAFIRRLRGAPMEIRTPV